MLDGEIYLYGSNLNNMSGIWWPNSIQPAKYFDIPIKAVPQFTVVMKSIKCGANHCLAIDSEGRIYAWGSNDKGQLGLPMRFPDGACPIDGLDEYKVIDIDCGYDHSYCKTSDGYHWLWGNNENNICLYFAEYKCPQVGVPRRVNAEIDKLIESEQQTVIAVILGNLNTKIVLSCY